MDSPVRRPALAGKLLILFTLGLFVVLVKLGFWQLSRAEEKQQLLAAQEARFQATPLTMDNLVQTPLQQVQGARMEVTGTLLATPTLLLDNQVMDGKVGYLAYRLLQVPGYKALLPVELGFIAAGNDRRILPQLSAEAMQLTLRGRLYQRQANPMSQGLGAEAGEPMRIQALDINALSVQLGKPLLNICLQPDTMPGLPLPRRWMPVSMPVEKHLGYAAQWFSLAGALLVLTLLYWIRTRKKSNTSSGIETQ
ncbi:SURF1 family protein [Shewanella khirikhana]|uniref:SURF1 family protein n=1 Tax=Shewanella khirikhana TaxID=1965282 RepID=UPI0013DF4908|nr:SURF1 family protein [Shewanella khirikhana]